MLFDVGCNRYRIISMLGEGGSSRVYRAELRGPMGFVKPVAIKVFKPLKDEKKNDRRMSAFIREARLGGLLKHPNIVDVYDFGKMGDHYYIVMELLEGCSLKHLIRKFGPPPVSVSLQIAQQICQALHAAHSHHIKNVPAPVIHRDLKPANIMLERHGTVKLVDFGIARHHSVRVQDWRVQGTAAYMAPEQITREHIDGRTDLFSLGILLYELISGRRLFRGPVPQLIRARLKIDTLMQDPEIWSPIDAVCKSLRPVIQKCLRRNLDERYRSANHVRGELAHIERSLAAQIQLSDWMIRHHRPLPISEWGLPVQRA